MLNNESYNLTLQYCLMMKKKEDHNTGVSDGIKKFFNGKPYQEFLKSTLLRI